MNNKELFKEIGNINDDLIENAGKVKSVAGIKHKSIFLHYGKIAACFALVLGLGVFHYINTTPNVPQITSQTPSASPTGPRKMFNYNGYRYAFVNDGCIFEISDVDMSKSLGTLEFDILEDMKDGSVTSYGELEFSTTFALGGILYEIPTYPSRFRVAVYYEDNYYLAEIVGNTDNSEISAKEYLDLAGIKEKTDKVEILSHSGSDVLKEIKGKSKIQSVIDELYQSKSVDLASEDYEAIGRAQSQGKSFQLSFRYKDGTSVQMYIIPELRNVSIGDESFELTEKFIEQFGAYFSGLEQEPLPLY